MFWIQCKYMEFLKFKLLENIGDVVHFVTDRNGGISTEKYASLNLSMKVGDDPANVLENRKILADSVGIGTGQILFPDQCHTNHIKEIKNTVLYDNLDSTDGLITRDKGICLCVLAADCVPVILYDPEGKAVAALHAGWRGTCEKIVSEAVQRMGRNYSSNPEHILACIGPSISQKYYEVGDEVSASFRSMFSDHPEIVRYNPDAGKNHIDLQAANRILLQKSGLTGEHIEIMNVCTYSHPELFFSARRDGYACGRFASGIMLT